MSGTETALSSVLAEVREYVLHAKAANTVRSYRADWRHFERWCAGQGREALPASVDTIALYVTELARTHRVSTLTRRLAALAGAHRLRGAEPPTAAPAIRTLLAGIRRLKGTARRPKKPLLVEDLELLISALPATLSGLRDRALLLVGFAGAFRRSELVGLNWEDVDFAKQGLVIAIRRSKTDPEGQGRKIAIPYGRRDRLCPVRALEPGATRPVATPDRSFSASTGTATSAEPAFPTARSPAPCSGLCKPAASPRPNTPATVCARASPPPRLPAAPPNAPSCSRPATAGLPVLRRYIREGSLF